MSPKCMQRPKDLKLFSVAFSDHYQGVGSDVEQLGDELVPIWNLGILRWKIILLNHHASPKIYRNKIRFIELLFDL